MVAVTKNKKGDKIFKILNSETTGPIGTNLCLDSPWMTPFQKPLLQKLKRGDEILIFSL